MGGDGITLQNGPNFDEFKPLKLLQNPGCSSCDEIKTPFLSLIRHFFKKLDGPRLCLLSLVRLGLETPARGLSLCVGP